MLEPPSAASLPSDRTEALNHSPGMPKNTFLDLVTGAALGIAVVRSFRYFNPRHTGLQTEPSTPTRNR